MNMVEVIRNCGWQVIMAVILLVQFLTVLHLRRVVRRYEYWYAQLSNQQAQPTMQQQGPFHLLHRR